MSYGTTGFASPYSAGAAERCTGSVKAADHGSRAIDTRDRLATGLTPNETRIFEFVRRRPGIMANDLHEAMWGRDPNGGPDIKCLHVTICNLNKKIAAQDLRIFAGSGFRSGYRLEKLNMSGFMIGLPRPPSVNRFVRKLGNRSPEVQEWIRSCDRCIMAMRPKPSGVRGEFEVTITWDQRQFGKFDLDNMIKPLLDYLQRVELIENDRLCRKLQVGWGPASMGCIVAVMPCR